MCEKCFHFLLYKFKFLWKNGVSEKIKAHLPQKPPALQQLFSPHLFNLRKKKKLTPPTFKEGRDYAFYMRDYKGETIKLLHLRCNKGAPFYMTDFLFTEL